jgi:hypothetical protein
MCASGVKSEEMWRKIHEGVHRVKSSGMHDAAVPDDAWVEGHTKDLRGYNVKRNLINPKCIPTNSGQKHTTQRAKLSQPVTVITSFI